MSKEESRQTQLNQYKIPGMRSPRNHQEAEKPKEGKKTLRRLLQYFSSERRQLWILFFAV